MKVQITGLQKQFGHQILFDDLHYTFPEKGLVAILGSSGCGKTTLLKILAGLDDDYRGSVTLGTFPLKGTSASQRECFRLEHMGFVFQDFRLLNMDSVEANILVSYLPFHQVDQEAQKRRVQEMLHWVGLDGFEKRIVNTLSGGEKQRVSLARALIKDPSIIFADEPTGALDSAHGEQVLSILKKMARNRLVLVVTHDEGLARKYANEIVRIIDGRVEKEAFDNFSTTYGKTLFSHPPKNKTSRRLPLTWSLPHAHSNLKQKKWRTAISQMALGTSLVGVGISLSLSGTISGRIEKALSSMLGDPSIVMTPSQNDANANQDIFGAPLDEALALAEEYPDFIDGVGITYENNFEDMFQDANRLVMAFNGQKTALPSFSMRLINDFQWLDDVPESVLPLRPPKMENDEVVLGMAYDDLKVITSALQIKQTVMALSSYLENHEIRLSFELRNDEWSYEDEQLFTLIGFYLTETPLIVHTNPLWNQEIFETAMRFPVTSDFSGIPEYPWTLRKVPVLHGISEVSMLLDKAQREARFSPFVLERLRVDSHPSLCGVGLVCLAPRVALYLMEKNDLEIGTIDFIRKTAPFLGHYVVCSPHGYALYPEAFMAGFSQETFFSSSPTLLNEVIDAVGVVSAQEQNQTFVLPNGILSGSLLKSGDDAVRLHPLPKSLLMGRYPLGVNEILISEKMARLLFSSSKESMGKALYVANMLKETTDSTLTIHRTFGVATLTIVGIVPGSTSFIAHRDDWGISFFRDVMGKSAFDLLPSAVAFEMEGDVQEAHLQRLNQQFPAFEFTNPSAVISDSLNQTTQYVSWILFCLSGLGILISALLLGLVLYLFLLENKAENELFWTLGFSAPERRRLAMMMLWVLSGQTLLLSLGEMFALDVGLGLYLDNYFNVSSGLNVLSLPYWVMTGVTFLLTFVVGYVMTFQKNGRQI